MKKLHYFFFLLTLPFLAYSLHAQPEVTPALTQVLAEKGEEEFISVNLRLVEQYDDQALYQQSRTIDGREARRSYVINELKQFSAHSQAGLLGWLQQMEADGKVRAIRPFWIGNLINAEARPEVIEQLITRKDLARVDYNQVRKVLMSDTSNSRTPVAEPDHIRTPDNLAWNVTLINADQVWAEGFNGEGAIVAVLDTGINYNHLDITDNMWEHPDYPGHGYNFVDNNYNTMDNQSHGTHCAGTVAGTGAAGTGTGIAPGATIMNLKVLDDGGSGTEAGVWAAIEFAADYGAHVMSLSLGWQHSWGPDRSMWRTTMNNALSAGVIAAVAAGNEGSWGSPPPSQVRTPGDVPPPWLHPDQTLEGGVSAVVSVGSTTSSDALSSFSSKGPVTWQSVAPFNDYPYSPGMGLIRPDVTAPGSDILSLVHNNNTGYTVKSGTSMATPAVAGLMALMISKNPNLTPEEISQILEESAIPMTEGKSNTFGSGRVDALAAIMQTPYMGVAYVDHTLDDSQGNDNGIINPGEHINLDISFENPTDEDILNVVISLETESPFIEFVNDYHFIETFPANQVITFEDVFAFNVSEGIHGNHEVEIFMTTYSQSDSDSDPWTGSIVEVSEAPQLVFSNIVVDDSEDGNDSGLLDPGETAWLTITLTNNGQMASTPGNVFMQSEEHWITVLSYGTQELPALEPGESLEYSFEVAAFHDTPLESAAAILFNANTETQEYVQTKYIIVGEAPYYSEGDIPSTMHYYVTTSSSAVYPGQMTVTIPEGAVITSVDVEYSITSKLGVHMSNQVSFLRCVSPGGTTEPEVSTGSGNETGTYDYARSGLSIANNVQGGGDIEFQLHVFRNHGGFGSNTTYVFAPNETWKVIVYYELPEYDVTFRVENQFDELVEGAIVEVGNTVEQTDEAGEALFGLPEGTLYYSVTAENHRSLLVQPFEVMQGDNLIEVSMLRVFQATFDITDINGNAVPNATIIIDGLSFDAGLYTIGDLETGVYSYTVEADGYNAYAGEFEIADDDVMVEVTLEPGSDVHNVHFDVKDEQDNEIADAIITLNGVAYEPGHYLFLNLPTGVYSYVVEALCYSSIEGTFSLTNQSLELDMVLSVTAGDANGDNMVNVLDVIAAVSYFTGQDVEMFCFDNADVNTDEVVNILDVIGIINIFTEGKLHAHPRMKSADAHIFLHDNTVMLESDGTLAGLQLELNGAGLNLTDVIPALPNHRLDYVVNGETLMAAIYSLDNTPLPQGKIELFTLGNDPMIASWGEVLAGNLNADEVQVVTYDNDVTSTQDLDFAESVDIFPNPAAEMVSVSFYNPGGEATVSLLNTSGQRIKSLQTTDEEGHMTLDFNLTGITPGVYILTIDNRNISTHKLIIR
jgi:subtilisin family serine protease